MAAPHRSDSTSSDDEEAAPESLSLTDSRRDVEKQADTLKQFQAAEKEKKRARNRERDRRLKEQAEQSRRRRKEVDESGVDSEARMTRAMEEAEAELGDHEGNDHRQGEFQGIIADPGNEGESHDGEDDEASHSNDEANKPHVIESRPNPNHLPEHLFASAFASRSVQPTKSPTKRKADEENSKRRVKKRVGNDNSSRDRVVGSKTIRTLSHDQRPSGAGTIPSSKVKKFMDRTLALKGGNPRTRGWERRAANIGSMKHNGPASNFVRNS